MVDSNEQLKRVKRTHAVCMMMMMMMQMMMTYISVSTM